LDGILDDIKQIVRPVDAEGNPLPISTIEISITNESAAKLGAIVIAAIIFHKIIN